MEEKLDAVASVLTSSSSSSSSRVLIPRPSSVKPTMTACFETIVIKREVVLVKFGSKEERWIEKHLYFVTIKCNDVDPRTADKICDGRHGNGRLQASAFWRVEEMGLDNTHSYDSRSVCTRIIRRHVVRPHPCYILYGAIHLCQRYFLFQELRGLRRNPCRLRQFRTPIASKLETELLLANQTSSNCS